MQEALIRCHKPSAWHVIGSSEPYSRSYLSSHAMLAVLPYVVDDTVRSVLLGDVRFPQLTETPINILVSTQNDISDLELDLVLTMYHH